MSASTKISIPIRFKKAVKLRHVSSHALQKHKEDAQDTKIVLGAMRPRVESTIPVLHWSEETDPIAKTVSLSVKEVRAKVWYSGKIMIDKDIDRDSPCYEHVFDHEKRHARIWKKGIRRVRTDIRQDILDAVDATPENPKVVKVGEASKARAATFKKIDAAMTKAVRRHGERVQVLSREIHTKAELKKTNRLCSLYLMR